MRTETNTVKNTAILFCAGLGDGLQMVPLWKALHKRGDRLILLLGTPYFPKEFAESLNLFHQIIVLNKNQFLFAVKNLFSFDQVIMDYYSSGPYWSMLACLISKKAYTNRNKWYLRLLPNLVFRKPIEEGHNIYQNLHLGGFYNPNNLNIEYKITELRKSAYDTNLYLGKYIVVQLHAANMQVTYKNWDLTNWIWLFSKIKEAHPDIQVVLIGDQNEADIADKVNEDAGGWLISLAGKTDLNKLCSVLSRAKMYLGLDSGPMHLAAMLGVPTFTLWGPSDPKTIGYEVLNNQLHKDLCLYISCHPCLSFIRHNNSLVDHPAECPNPRCIKDINRESVWKTYQMFWEQVYGNQ